MTIARSTIIDSTRPGAYHIISRYVRRAFLGDDDAEHRRNMIFPKVDPVTKEPCE